MRKILVFVFVILSFGQATAGPVRLIGVAKGGESVSALLERAGCHPLWLKKAIEDSRIEVGKSERLPRGQRVILKVEKCEPAPRSKATLVREKPARAQNLETPLVQERGFDWFSAAPAFVLGLMLGAVIMAFLLGHNRKVSASSRMTTGTSPGLGGPKS